MDALTRRLLSAYFQEAEISAYFSGMFRAPSQNFFPGETVEIDIQRSQENVAIAVQSLSSDYRSNTLDDYSSKSFKPPVFKEKVPINSTTLLSRTAGENPFGNPDFRSRLIVRVFSAMRLVQAKIARSMEMQAAQVMQTGMVTLSDENGVALYSVDFKPKAALMPTAGTSWASATLAQKLSDIEALCNAVRTHGLADPDEATLSSEVFENLVQTEGFHERFDAERAHFGAITPMEKRGGGGIYRGVLEVGNYKLDIFTYNGQYTHPQTGAATKYVNSGSFMVRASAAVRLDALFGAVPNIGRLLGMSSPVNIPELPTRFSSSANRADLNVNVWLSDDGETLNSGVATRVLMAPTSIDRFGCLDTQL